MKHLIIYLFAISKKGLYFDFCTAKLRITNDPQSLFIKCLRVAYQEVSKRIGRVSKRIEYADCITP